MRVLFDAGSLINLNSGQVLSDLASTVEYDGFISPLVRQECKSISAKLDDLIGNGNLQLLPDLDLTTEDFADLLRIYGMGVGETECLALGTQQDFTVSCDDRRARSILIAELGAEKVTGTLGLLILAVRAGGMNARNAFGSYQQMRARGGFLPSLSLEQFHELV